MKKTAGVIALLCMSSSSVWADDLDQLQNLAQDEFRTISEDLSGALSYKAVAPAEPLGITGFDVGLEVTATNLQSADLWESATGSDLSTLPVPKLHVHKGLPLGFDIGASYVSVPGSNIRLFGGELRYAVLEGGVTMPAVSVRGAFSRMSGVDQLDFDTRSIELAVSKGFLMLTPYAGIGQVWSDSTPHVAGLQEESYSDSKVFLGANLSLGLMNVALEADQTGDVSSISGKLGVRW